VPRHPRQKRAERAAGDWGLETSVPGECANTQLAPVLAYRIERSDAIDVAEARGTGKPKIHCRHEALSAGEDLSFPAARHGMPILDVERAKTVLFVKRPMASGYIGVENDLFCPDTLLRCSATPRKCARKSAERGIGRLTRSSVVKA